MKKIITSILLMLTMFMSAFIPTTISCNAEEEVILEKVEGIMDSLTFTNPLSQQEVEDACAQFVANNQHVSILYDYDSETGKYYAYVKEDIQVYFDTYEDIEQVAYEFLNGVDVYVIHGTYTIVSVPSDYKATLALSYDAADSLLSSVKENLTRLQMYQIMYSCNIIVDVEDEYYVNYSIYGKNGDGTTNYVDLYDIPGPASINLTDLDIHFDGDPAEYLCVIFKPQSDGVSPWIFVGIGAVVLAGVYFALGFLVYKKGKLNGKFFALIYKWIKK